MSVETFPLARLGMPLRELRVSVVAGPDQGRTLLAENAISVGSAEGNHLRLQDRTVSRFHLEVSRRADLILVTDRGSTNGTRIGPVRLDGATASVATGTQLELGGTRLRVDDGAVVMVEPGPAGLSDMVGRSAAMRQMFATLLKVAPTEVSVLVLGESGTGKELIGRALHEHSSRADAPMVTLDCGALSPSLFASELFGHERGAFTGAHRRHQGAFERASGGTVFLDEVGELPPELQSALLGVLERKQLRRVGGSEDIKVDVRVVSATSRDLRSQVNREGFRLDLFYRLAGVVVAVPPLRERPEDIESMAEHFARQAGYQGPLHELLDLQRLAQHSWPGNVRELKNTVLGALALGKTPDFSGAQAPSPPSSLGVESWLAALPLNYKSARDQVTDVFERHYLQRVLGETAGNIREAARRGEINRSYLMELLKKHGLR